MPILGRSRPAGAYIVVQRPIAELALPPFSPGYVQPNLNDEAIAQVLDKVFSYCMTTGRFDSVNGHEPKNAPGDQITCAIWVQSIKPAARSGLAATSVSLILNARIYIPFTLQPYDMIDPRVLAATTDIMAALSGDFDLGGVADVRYVDLLGIDGFPMSAQAGYLEIDKKMYRVMTISIPITVNDAFTQVA